MLITVVQHTVIDEPTEVVIADPMECALAQRRADSKTQEWIDRGGEFTVTNAIFGGVVAASREVLGLAFSRAFQGFCGIGWCLGMLVMLQGHLHRHDPCVAPAKPKLTST